MHPTQHHLAILLLAGVAGVGGGFLARAVEDAPPAARADRRAASGATDPTLGDVLARLAALEAQARDSAAARGLAGAPDGAVGKEAEPVVEKTIPGAADAPAPAAPPEQRDPLTGMLGKKFGYRESETLFERLARDRGAIGDAIARLEAEIAKDPRNADLHAALATAYGAKTAFDTPPGPEQGTVWEKAERAYDEAIRLDPEHWQARYGKAFGDSMAPEFVGLRPRAIRQFEELMEIQARKPLAPEHVEVYLRLGTLLKDAGNVKRAREVWQRGIDRFPDDKRIAEAIALVEEK